MLFPPAAGDLVPRIPLYARSVLDVGCGVGPQIAVYRAMNPQAQLLGIEFDPEAAAVAAPYMHQIAKIDPETDQLPFDVPEGIDCIVYNAILEHLRDPWDLLRRHSAFLSRNGVMLLCVPNFGYWRLTERMLRGSVEPHETEVPHAATLQAFDVESIQSGLVECGLNICDVTTREPDGDAATRFVTSLAPGLDALGIDPRQYMKRAAVSHLICRVRKGRSRRMILSGNMLDPVGGVSHVRVVYPFQAIATDPTVTARVTDRIEAPQPGNDDPRIFVLHRPALYGEQGHAVFRQLTEAGYLVVTEFDDLPDRFDMMKMGGALSFYGAHAVQTSTIPMANALRPFNPEIAVFPNAITALPEVRNFADPETITLFFGALNRERDWLPFMPTINEIAALAGARLRIQVVHDQAFFDALETPHKAFTPTCDYATYLRLLAGAEISIMPLADTPFNRAKSDLKFIEAASCRVAALASSVVYGDSIEDGRTGLLFRDPEQFRAGLLRLLAMPNLARDLGDAARSYVTQDRMLAYQVAPRVAWYRSLWARREDLAAARRMRMLRFSGAA